MESLQERASSLVIRAASLGVDLSAAAAETMLRYLERMLVVNESLNLTGVRDPEVAVERHLLDSLAFGMHVAGAGAPRVLVDVGTGGGFPGVPIAIAWPSAEVHLLDATRKKIDAVRELVDGLEIDNVHGHWARAESLRDLPRADAVTARAVGPLAELLQRTNHLVARGGFIVIWKSDDVPAAERSDAARLLPRLGLESLPDIEYELDRKRRLVRYRRRHQPPHR